MNLLKKAKKRSLVFSYGSLFNDETFLLVSASGKNLDIFVVYDYYQFFRATLQKKNGSFIVLNAEYIDCPSFTIAFDAINRVVYNLGIFKQASGHTIFYNSAFKDFFNKYQKYNVVDRHPNFILSKRLKSTNSDD